MDTKFLASLIITAAIIFGGYNYYMTSIYPNTLNGLNQQLNTTIDDGGQAELDQLQVEASTL